MNTKYNKHIHVPNFHVFKRFPQLLEFVAYKVHDKTLMIMERAGKHNWSYHEAKVTILLFNSKKWEFSVLDYINSQLNHHEPFFLCVMKLAYVKQKLLENARKEHNK